jgi:hypothetical protein
VSDITRIARYGHVPDLVTLLVVDPVDAERLWVPRLEALQQ